MAITDKSELIKTTAENKQKKYLLVEGNDTLANVIRRELADKILKEEFKLGENLDEQRLANYFGVSRTPIREALRQLDEAGLIKLRARRAAVIVEVNEELKGHLFESAAELESISASWAAMRSTLSERNNLFEINQNGKKAAENNDSDAYAIINRKYHSFISDMSRNPSFSETVNNIRKKIGPFQKALFNNHRDIKISQYAHDHITEAIYVQDNKKAMKYMKKHILQASLQKHNH
jgi:DNA-binding GntR family transcriptional regulator